MRKHLLTLICALCALLFLSVTIQAEVLFSESFDGMETGRLSKGDWSSGTIPSDGWYTYGGPSTFRQVVAQQLTYSGYCSTASGKAVASLSGQQKDYILFPAGKQHASISSGEKYYMSFLYRVTELNLSTNALNGTNTYIAGLLTANNQTGIAYTNAQVMATPINASTYKLGIRKITETAQYAEEVLNINTTYLIVAEYIVNSGNADDIVNLYINPSKDSKTVAATNTQVSAPTDKTGIVGVGILGISNAPTSAIVDELKVTTSWNDLWEAGGDTPEPEPEPDPIPVPSPVVSSITLTSANVAWNAVENADSYVLQWKVKGGSYSDDIAINKDVRSYSMSGLESETKYYVRVKTIVGEEASEWAEINFNTSSEPEMLVYKDISFNKYSTQDAMPTSGTVFLAKHVVEYNDVTLTGNLTLNLHGKQLFMYGGHIVVPSGVTLTIYDDAGTGEISGGYAGSFVDRGIISVKEGGTLIIGEGAVINIDDESEQVAIHNNGTLRLSGAPVISGNKTDIYLGSTITIESGKPLTNETPYKVYKATGSSFTSGWANMDGESPKDYFSSTNVGNGGVCLNASGEAQIVPALNLSEDSNNPSIASNNGQLVNASFTRSLTSSQYNTFCLPFALDDDQLKEFFGAGYDLEEFVSSSLEGDVLNLVFNKVTSLEAGKPYLLQPSVDVANPSFEGVTIAATEPADQTSDANISFHATFAPTELEGGNKNLLFLGADNELFYPVSTANIKAFRAYFELKGAAQKAAKRARIVKKEDSATGIDQITNDKSPMTNKIIKDGQLLILRDNKTYNVIGQMVK